VIWPKNYEKIFKKIVKEKAGKNLEWDRVIRNKLCIRPGA